MPSPVRPAARGLRTGRRIERQNLGAAYDGPIAYRLRGPAGASRLISALSRLRAHAAVTAPDSAVGGERSHATVVNAASAPHWVPPPRPWPAARSQPAGREQPTYPVAAARLATGRRPDQARLRPTAEIRQWRNWAGGPRTAALLTPWRERRSSLRWASVPARRPDASAGAAPTAWPVLVLGVRRR